MARFTLKQCAYFLAVAEHGGIAQAARALNISQPAIAQAIDKLEGLTGLRLFDRFHARGVTLTAQGRAFQRPARALLDQAATTEAEAAAIAADLSGLVRVGCFHTIAPFCMAQLVQGYRALYPGVEVRVFERRQDELVTGLRTNALDLAVTYDMALDTSDLEGQVLARLKPVVILSEGHPLAARSSISLKQLAEEPLVLFDGAGSRDYFRSLLAEQGIDPPVAFTSGSMESVRSAVGNGLGFSITVMRPSQGEAYDGSKVVTVQIADDVQALAVMLVRKRDTAAAGPVANFSEFCLARAAALF